MSSSLLPKRASDRSSGPKYVDLAHRLLHEMGRNRLKPGDRIGTEIELGKKHGVSRLTVRQALSLLEKDGYISRRRRTGTIVEKLPDETQHLGLVRGSVAVVCPHELAEHPDEDVALLKILRVMDEVWSKRGLTLQMLSVGKDVEADRARIRQLSHRDDLVGVCSPWGCVEPYQELLPNLPVVVTGFHSNRFPLVGVDIRAACQASIAYLLSHGHRKIALVCGPWTTSDVFALFAEGYRDAFRASGLAYQRNLLYLAHAGESLGTLAHEALSCPPRPTAVFADNYRLCETIIQAAADLDLVIPDDVSLIGYGETVLRLQYPVRLTAFVPDNEKIGEAAARMILAMIDGETRPDLSRKIAGKMVEQASVRHLQTEPADSVPSPLRNEDDRAKPPGSASPRAS